MMNFNPFQSKNLSMLWSCEDHLKCPHFDAGMHNLLHYDVKVSVVAPMWMLSVPVLVLVTAVKQVKIEIGLANEGHNSQTCVLSFMVAQGLWSLSDSRVKGHPQPLFIWAMKEH